MVASQSPRRSLASVARRARRANCADPRATNERRMMALVSPPEGVKVLSISELTQAVKVLLEDGFPQVWVTGESSNIARPSSGHIYLTLKDPTAQLRAVMWRSGVGRLRFEPRDGMEVFAGGRLSVYPARGEYQLVIEQL